MRQDRYLKVVLTLIALELLWLASNQSPLVFAPIAAAAQPPTSAPAPAPLPVIITGIQLNPNDPMLPVQVMGIVSVQAPSPLKVEADRPLPVMVQGGKPTRMPAQ
jgi:hypothetical protein